MSDSAGSDNLLLIDDIEDNFSMTEEDLIEAEAACLKQKPVSSANPVLARPDTSKNFFTPDRTSIFGKPFSGESNKKSIDPRIANANGSNRGFKFGQPTTGTATVSSTSVSGGGFLSLTTGRDFSVKRTVRNDISTAVGRNDASPVEGLSNVRGQDIPSEVKVSRGKGPHVSLDQGILKMEEMRQTQEDKIRAESEKMEKIERIIALKKQKQQVTEQQNRECMMPTRPGKEAWLLSETQRLNNEMKQREERMLEERRMIELERRRLDDQKQILDLQLKVQNLEKLVQDKQGVSNSRPIRERVGQIGGMVSGDWKGELDKRMQDRKRRFEEGKSSKFVERWQLKGNNKNKKYRGLPEDLVLTELTEEGPVPKKKFREEDRAQFGEENQDLSEEFEEDGFVPVEF